MKTLKLLVAAALAMAATLMPLMVLADVQTDWYSGLKDKKNLTLLSVGDERIWVDDVALPYRFPHSGAVLHSTLGGYRLDLSGVAITGFYWSSGERGIWADGDIAVFLQGQNTIAVAR